MIFFYRLITASSLRSGELCEKKERQPDSGTPLLKSPSAVLPMETIENLIRRAPLDQMPLKTRSAAIKCCQAQFIPPDATTPLGLIVQEAPLTRLITKTTTCLLSLFEVLEPFAPYITSPLYSQRLLDAIRDAKMPIKSIEEAFEASAIKELSACEDEEIFVNWNFDAFFVRGCQNQSVLPDHIAPNQYANTRIINYLEQWRSSVSQDLHYPKVSSKTLATNTFDEMEYSERALFTDAEIESQRDWLYLYFKTGVILDGESELRQRWYPANHKPRTYYSAGGTAFAASIYLQSVFQSLTDFPPYTNKFLRLNPSRLRLKDGQHLRIYDLESFSTRLTALKPFLHYLSNFCSGWGITTVDPRHGLVNHDLGEVIAEYLRDTTDKPPVRYTRVYKGNKEEVHGQQGLSGMLGIFGNIALCTVLHGFVMSTLVEDEDQLNAAGDDGAIAEDRENSTGVDVTIRCLGRYARDKSFSSKDAGAICLKQPISQYGLVIVQRQKIPFPNSTMVDYWIDNRRDPRFKYRFPMKMWRTRRVTIVGAMLLTFLRRVWTFRYALDPCEILYALQYTYNITRRMETSTNLTIRGGVPMCGDKYLWPAITMNVEEFCRKAPDYRLVDYCYTGSAVVSEYRPTECSGGVLESPGDMIISEVSKKIALYRNLGLVMIEKVARYVVGMEGYSEVCFILSQRPIPLYRITCVSPIPSVLSF